MGRSSRYTSFASMANILYGVNGEGSGHSTRAKEVITHLQNQGHTVHIVSFDRGLRNLSESFDVTEIYGFRFAYVNNQMRYRRTLGKNLLTAPKAAKSFARLMKLVEEWKTDLVITDFEPLSCHVARRKRLPVISSLCLRRFAALLSPMALDAKDRRAISSSKSLPWTSFLKTSLRQRPSSPMPDFRW